MSTSIFDLPTEMIAHIFSFVSHKKDRRNLALISKKFHKIVREQSKKHNRIDLFDNPTQVPLSIFQHCDEFPFQKLRLHSEHIEQYRSLWRKHGPEITQMTFTNDWNDFGNDFKELFPNLRNLFYDWGAIDLSSTKVKHFFSENIKYLELRCEGENLKHLGSVFALFPGLNHLKLTVSIYNRENDSQMQELKDILDKWLPQLEKIEFSFSIFGDVQLLEAFDGLIDEKLSFENLMVKLTKRSINILKKFFNVTRHVKSFGIIGAEIVLDSTFCTLIEKNASIDRLNINMHVGDEDGYFAKLRCLINAPGVKEIYVIGNCGRSVSLGDCIHFIPEALLKVKEIAVRIEDDESLLMIPQFRNLRKLNVKDGAVGNDELAFFVHNFPHLENLDISGLSATNGHLLTHLTRIRNLKIRSSPRLLNAFFDFGAKLPNLETLRLLQCPNITLNGVKSIVANCPRIREIAFYKCPKISEKCFDFVAKRFFYVERIFSDFNAEIRHNLKRKYPELEFYAVRNWII